MKKIDALSLMLKQRRFDLIYKYLYVKRPNAFHRAMYIEHLRALNGFHEMNPTDGPKESPEDFLSAFDKLIQSLKTEGYKETYAPIPIGPNGEIQDGAHRLSACAALGMSVPVEDTELNYLYDYRHFIFKKAPQDLMDFGALEYVKLNPHAYIANLQPVTNPKFDDQVEAILNKYGVVFYKKAVRVTFNGLVNLKKLSYGSFWDREEWIGTAETGFAGARGNAKETFGRYPMRVFVFVCDDIEKVLAAKADIRAVFNIGNSAVHINDHHEEAVWLAEIYFNANSLFTLNNRPFEKEDKVFEANIEYLREEAKKCDVSLEDVCGAGSTPLNALLARHSDDLDYLSIDSRLTKEDEIISPHDTELKYYPYSKEEIITNPAYHQYYHGMKFISLDVLYKMKRKRGEVPKDVNDCRTIRQLRHSYGIDPQLIKLRLKQNKYTRPFVRLYKKIRDKVLR